jgi:hypothetical protein
LCCPHPPPPPPYIHIRVIASDGLFPPFFSFFPPARPGCDSFRIVKREKTLGPDEFRRCSGIIGRTDGCISLTHSFLSDYWIYPAKTDDAHQRGDISQFSSDEEIRFPPLRTKETKRKIKKKERKEEKIFFCFFR